MKKFLLSLMLFVSAVSYADDYKYLIVEKKSGDLQTYALSGLTITMDNSVLTFQNTEVSDDKQQIADVEKMYFSETSAAIDALFSGNGTVEAYDLDGKKLGRFSSRQEMEQKLGRGVFLIKSAEGVKKEVMR